MAFWLALAVFLIAIVAAAAYAALRGLTFWRDAKRGGGSLTAEMERISAVSVEIEQRMAEASAAAERLQVATGRLADSRARLDVQLAAVREARAQVRRVFWFVPGV